MDGSSIHKFVAMCRIGLVVPVLVLSLMLSFAFPARAADAGADMVQAGGTHVHMMEYGGDQADVTLDVCRDCAKAGPKMIAPPAPPQVFRLSSVQLVARSVVMPAVDVLRLAGGPEGTGPPAQG